MISFLTALSRLVIIKILAVSDVGIAQPITGDVDSEEFSALARHIPQGFSLRTRSSRAALTGGNQLITQRFSATITLGVVVQTFVPASVIGACVVTLILVDHRLVRLGGGGHGGE